jgi:hypothetical protein
MLASIATIRVIDDAVIETVRSKYIIHESESI